jgi:hypothetical protein
VEASASPEINTAGRIREQDVIVLLSLLSTPEKG